MARKEIQKKSYTLPAQWDYDTQVECLRHTINLWKKNTVEIARMLYEAHEFLSNPGFRADLVDTTSGQMARGEASVIHTFEEFCEEAGIPYRTAKRYVALFVPETGSMLTAEELNDKKMVELDALFESVHEARKTVEHFIPKDEDIEKALHWNKNIRTWSRRVEDAYLAWAQGKGYEVIRPNAVVAPVSGLLEGEHGQFGLFGEEYLSSLVEECEKKTMGNGAVAFMDMVNKYDRSFPKGVKSTHMLRLPVIAEVLLEEIPEEARHETARVLGEIIMTLGGK